MQLDNKKLSCIIVIEMQRFLNVLLYEDGIILIGLVGLVRVL